MSNLYFKRGYVDSYYCDGLMVYH
uniref:Uncharacterized protein n=1 Tax=Physcomitrium patens TaxID=3218 RepID=A0A2K1K4C5_PHYPA|nr:hypothetical protein PHYPA_013106 [Physcomitrium patens]